MILHKKSISNEINRLKCFLAFFVLLILLLIPFPADAGEHTFTDFPVSNDGISDIGLQYTTVLELGVNKFKGVKIFGDSLQSAATNTNYPDVISSSIDTFTFVYALDNISDGVFKRDINIIGGFSALLSSPVKINDPEFPDDSYLHADKGESGFLVSFVRNGEGQHRVLRLSTEVSHLDIDSATTTGWLFSSQCHMEKDTFLVVYSKSMTSIQLKKVYAKGSDIQIIDSTVVSADTAGGNRLMNCSVASDGSNGILVSWTNGTPIGDKYGNYRFFTRDFTAGTSNSINKIVGDNYFYYYDALPVAALDTNLFAMTHWDNTGIVLDIIEINNGIASRTTNRIISRPALKHTSIASNGKYCIIACYGDADGDGYAGVEGLRYTVDNRTLIDEEVYTFSRKINIIPSNSFSTALNCVLDTANDFALTWRYKSRIEGAVFANRGIRNQYGFWTSPVESLMVTSGDSVRFYNSIKTVSNLTSWTLADSIRFGATSQACQSAAWISLADEQQLLSNASTNRYFQYRVAIARNINGDSLNTPGISSITLPWNAQPVIASVDSIKIGKNQYTQFISTDSISVFTRDDSLRFQITIRDSNLDDTIYMKGSWPADPAPIQLTGSTLYKTSLPFQPATVDTSIQCTISVWDSRGWQAVPVIIPYKSKNAQPELHATAIYHDVSGTLINRSILPKDTILIQEIDSLEIQYAITDTNDQGRVSGLLLRNDMGIMTKLDSITGSQQGTFIIRGDTSTQLSPKTLHIVVNDEETTFSYDIVLKINHIPVIDSINLNALSVKELDTMRVAIGSRIEIDVFAYDPDCNFGDTLTYYFKTADDIDSIVSDVQQINYGWVPVRADSFMTVIVSDINNKSDSITFYIKFPWFEIDSSINQAYAKALDTLSGGISLIIGSPIEDTVVLPIVNNGNDTLVISSISGGFSQEQWVSICIPYDTGIFKFDYDNTILPSPVKISANDTLNVSFVFSVGTLAGDGIVTDSVFFITNDSSHTSVTVPVYLEYNDLPKIISINPDFIPDIPWRLSKRKMNQYSFPPHASVSIAFSEPIDTASIYTGLSIYSVIDSSFTGTANPIGMEYQWSQNYTKLNCTPVYNSQSEFYKIFPSKGLFIPTDVIALNLNASIVDRASTPSGPNRLDVNFDNSRDGAASDTTIRMNIDSVGFSVLSISPAMYDTQVIEKPQISLRFSSPVYASSVDKSLSDNRTLIIRSKYNGGQQLAFDSISIDEGTVTFQIARKLFYSDSLWCWYNSRTIKNQMGFPSDNNNNGIPISMFDTTSTSDDIFWSYRVKNITIHSLSPVENSTVKEVSPPIFITFSDTIDESVIDTTTASSNRSFQIWSRYSLQRSAFKSIQIQDDRKTVRIQPQRKFFSMDSVFCTFFGFNANYRYSEAENIPVDSQTNFGGYSWAFYTGNTGFYTYPNPYKPNKVPSHCFENGPCGIWFKNLHILKQGVTDVVVTIYSMSSHSIYNSRDAGIQIHFESNSTEFLPQWLWDTKNNKGDLVASGLYFYTIADLEDHILTKGKLMIVR